MLRSAMSDDAFYAVTGLMNRDNVVADDAWGQ